MTRTEAWGGANIGVKGVNNVRCLIAWKYFMYMFFKALRITKLSGQRIDDMKYI